MRSGFATRAIHGGAIENAFGCLATPIYQTSTFVFDTAEQGGRRFAGEEDGYIYTRLGNPNCTQVEEKLAMLEGGEAAASASSGIGAISSAIWVCVKAGDHILLSDGLVNLEVQSVVDDDIVTQVLNSGKMSDG